MNEIIEKDIQENINEETLEAMIDIEDCIIDAEVPNEND